MSKKRLRGAQALIDQMGAGLPDDEKEKNQQQSETSAPETKQPENPVEDIDKTQPKPQISTTVLPSTLQSISQIQEHALAQGWKKPKIGEIIDEGVRLVLEKRGLEGK